MWMFAHGSKKLECSFGDELKICNAMTATELVLRKNVELHISVNGHKSALLLQSPAKSFRAVEA
jgi:hypothetical protein